MALRHPLPKICIALGFPDIDKLLQHAQREIDEGERFLEFRLDYLPDPWRGAEAIRSFLAQYPGVAILATCRRHQNRGKVNGSIEDQIRVLDAAIDAGAEAVGMGVERGES